MSPVLVFRNDDHVTTFQQNIAVEFKAPSDLCKVERNSCLLAAKFSDDDNPARITKWRQATSQGQRLHNGDSARHGVGARFLNLSDQEYDIAVGAEDRDSYNRLFNKSC